MNSRSVASSRIYSFGGYNLTDDAGGTAISLRDIFYSNQLELHYTLDPTFVPTAIPTSTPIIVPTKMPTAMPVDPSELLKQEFETSALNALFIAYSVGTLLVIISYLIRKVNKKMSHDPKHIYILAFIHSAVDFYTDIIFSAILYFEGIFILLFPSIGFILLAYIGQLCVCTYYIRKWTKGENDSIHRLSKYIASYGAYIVGTAVFGANFYNVIDLMQGQFLTQSCFNLSLKKTEYDSIKTLKFINVVLIENIPQIVIQLIYLMYFDDDEIDIDGQSDNENNDGLLLFDTGGSNMFVYVSVLMSFLSLLFSTIRQIHRYFDYLQLKNEWKNKFSDKTTINGNFTIKCDKLNFGHGFANKSIQKCFNDFLGEAEGKEQWNGNTRFEYDIEIYYITIHAHTTDGITVYYQITIKHCDDRNIMDQFHRTIERMGIKSPTASPENAAFTKVECCELYRH